MTLLERLPSAMIARCDSIDNIKHQRATSLLRKCKKLGQGSLHKKRQMQSKVKVISGTLSFGVSFTLSWKKLRLMLMTTYKLLGHIRTTLLHMSEGIQQADHTAYDTAGIPSLVQEIKALQAILQTTEGEDEQLSLEEDITGKARPPRSHKSWNLIVR
ncbi:hypothetical protein M404DRAFT_508866 [Pisolithus tinctorius Marx 270]|uniref:Uncharacterized protein n=1 Tax=Pisolithus tinctorius Marx 270 TaxID=870435 RepID=A0A0C3PD05_PISTI|nr:hypothetical protein M404DRAFT_508866 [Pisolithus tinctorius Marx 270]